jgi:L-aspartate oxidase
VKIPNKTDFLVIGSGIAGLSYAYKVATHFEKSGKKVSITLITKASEDESNTKYAQGGIASVTKTSDTFESHIQDTLVAGDGLCDPEIVRMVVESAPERIQELIAWGSRFDKNEQGEYDLAKEGGHSDHRILHHKDATGNEIERALLEKVMHHPLIQVLNHCFAVDLITQHHLGEKINKRTPDKKCFGVYLMDRRTHKIHTLLSKITLLATGGAGQVYASTTNPTIATGDGIAMAYRAKAIVENVEFIQFHPTALFNPDESPAFLISEAVRGAGAILKNHRGEAFMKKYDARLDLAPRDIVARAIDAEMKKRGRAHVFLDTTQIDLTFFKSHFPNIYEKCMSLGIDPAKDMIPVVPAAHYMCGGIKVDRNGKTSIQRLYASGECSCTGLHGANRLASNSLSEALVFSHNAFLESIKELENIDFKEQIPDWDDEGTQIPNEHILVMQAKKEVQELMSAYVGIVRSDERLNRALSRLKLIHEETEALYEKSKLSVAICQLRNLVNMGYLIISAAQARKENIGLHYNIDHINS